MCLLRVAERFIMSETNRRTETREPQYQCCIDLQKKQGLTSLGLMSNYMWHNDPRHLAFLLSRYKFVAKMLSGKEHVLEVGCADAFGTRVVLQEVRKLTAEEFASVCVKDAKKRMDGRWEFKFPVHHKNVKTVFGKFYWAYSV